jgi:hypothetical protein
MHEPSLHPSLEPACALAAYYLYFDEPFETWIVVPTVIMVALVVMYLARPHSVEK